MTITSGVSMKGNKRECERGKGEEKRLKEREEEGEGEREREFKTYCQATTMILRDGITER